MYVCVYGLHVISNTASERLTRQHFASKSALDCGVCMSGPGVHRFPVADASRLVDGHGVRFSDDGTRAHAREHMRTSLHMRMQVHAHTHAHARGHVTYTHIHLRVCINTRIYFHPHLHTTMYTQAALKFARYNEFPFTQFNSLVSHSLATQARANTDRISPFPLRRGAIASAQYFMEWMCVCQKI